MRTPRLSVVVGFAAPALLAATGVSQAQVDLTGSLVNPSFETPDTTTAVVVDFPGWGQGPDTGVNEQGQVGAPAAASSGTQMAFLGNGMVFTNIFQDVANAGQGSPTITGYTFTIGLAVRTTDPVVNGNIAVGIQDLDGGNPAVVTTVARSSLINTFQDFSVTLPAPNVTAGETIRIFVNKLSGERIVADNARLVAVPEPASLALLAAGPATLLLSRRRRSVPLNADPSQRTGH